MNSFFALLTALGLVSPYIGECYSFNSRPPECSYKTEGTADHLRATIGKEFMLGPWAEMTNDLRNPALVFLAGKSTIILNADIGGGPAMINIHGGDENRILIMDTIIRPLDPIRQQEIKP